MSWKENLNTRNTIRILWVVPRRDASSVFFDRLMVPTLSPEKPKNSISRRTRDGSRDSIWYQKRMEKFNINFVEGKKGCRIPNLQHTCIHICRRKMVYIVVHKINCIHKNMSASLNRNVQGKVSIALTRLNDPMPMLTPPLKWMCVLLWFSISFVIFAMAWHSLVGDTAKKNKKNKHFIICLFFIFLSVWLSLPVKFLTWISDNCFGFSSLLWWSRLYSHPGTWEPLSAEELRHSTAQRASLLLKRKNISHIGWFILKTIRNVKSFCKKVKETTLIFYISLNLKGNFNNFTH